MDIKTNIILDQDELNELEMLEVKGGIDFQSTIQNQCPNLVSGCACSINKDESVN